MPTLLSLGLTSHLFIYPPSLTSPPIGLLRMLWLSSPQSSTLPSPVGTFAACTFWALGRIDHFFPLETLSSLCLLPAKSAYLDFLPSSLKAHSVSFGGFLLLTALKIGLPQGFYTLPLGKLAHCNGIHHILFARTFKLIHPGTQLRSWWALNGALHISWASHNYLTLSGSPLYHSQSPICWKSTQVLLVLPKMYFHPLTALSLYCQEPSPSSPSFPHLLTTLASSLAYSYSATSYCNASSTM